MMSPRNQQYYLKSKGIDADFGKISLLNIRTILAENDPVEKKVASKSNQYAVKCPQPQVSRKLRDVCLPSNKSST